MPVTVNLTLLPDTFAVCRLSVDSPIPAWASSSFVSITRTADELSIVCAESQIPANIQAERSWRMLRVNGTLDFALIGILAALTAPLANAGISVFALSTFDTDYLLVKQDKLEQAVTSLIAAGHQLK
jgi:uncharacterized protein